MTERLPPFSEEAEQGVLGCLILDPKTSIPICIEQLKVGGEVFYDMRHAALYDALLQMSEQQKHIDPITLQQFLKDKNQLEALGGMPYIVGLMNVVPSAANLEYYLPIILEKYQLRKIIQACTSAVGKIYEEQANASELVDEIGKSVFEACEPMTVKANRSIKGLVHHAINEIESCHKSQGQPIGLSTGFPDLDKMTGGLRDADMIVIAARPSMGKTSLAMNIAEHVSIEEKKPVGIFSLEMTSEALTLRMLCSRARVNLRNVRDGFLAERDFPKLVGAAGKIANAPIYIDDTTGLNIMQLRAKARRMIQQYSIELFVIDYLQLLHHVGRIEKRSDQVAQISNGVKELAKELNVPIIILAQLNRKLDEDGGKKGRQRKPRLSDLRESGDIEQDADLVGMLYKAESNQDDDEDDAPQEIEAVPVNLLIAKQRNGPTGDVHLTFLKSYTRYESSSKVSDVPTETMF